MDDGAALLCQVVQHPLHDGRVVAAVCAEFFTQADLSVVVGNHLLDARGTDARVGGEIFSLFGSVVEIVFDVFRHAELVVQREDLVCVSLALCEIHGRCLVQVGEERAGLVVRNLLVHVAEFFAQCVETFGDELVGVSIHLLLWETTGNGWPESSASSARWRLASERLMFRMDASLSARVTESLPERESAMALTGYFVTVISWSVKVFPQNFVGWMTTFPTGVRPSVPMSTVTFVDAIVCDEIPKFCFFVREQFHFEGASELVACFGHEERDGRVVIERCVVQSFLHRHLDVGVGSFDGLFHQHGSAEDDDFVVDVGVLREDSQVFELLIDG